MFTSKLILTGFNLPDSWLGQIPIAPPLAPTTAENAALVFSGPQFFTALITGILLAFGFQLLLTNLGMATWFSTLGRSSSHSHIERSHSESDTFGGTIRKIGFFLGLGTLISFSIVLFFASICAVKLSLLASPLSGAIVGLVIWAAYLALVIWFSSTKLGSMLGTVVHTATSGFQALLGTASAVIGGKAVNQQVVHTAEAAAAAVRREIGTAIDPVSLRENIQDYVEALRPPELDWTKIRSDFENLLNDPHLHEIAGTEGLQSINRQTFVDLVRDRSDLSKREINRLADQLETVWKKTLKQSGKKDSLAEFVNYLKSASREQLSGGELTQKLDALAKELPDRQKSDSSGMLSQAMTFGFNSLMGLVLGRTDLSDLDVEKITGQFQKLKGKLGEQAEKITSQVGTEKSYTYSPIRADIENYLHHAHLWQLGRDNLNREFRDLLYDPEADPGVIQGELERINHSDFVALLQQKGMLTQDKIQTTADLLEEIRLECLSVAETAQEQERAIAVLGEVENYLLNTPKEDLTPEKIQLNFKPLLEDPNIDYDQLCDRLSEFDRATFERILRRRTDCSDVEASIYVNELELAKEQVLQEAQERQAVIQTKIEQEWLKVQTYLRETEKAKLTLPNVPSDLKSLLQDHETGAAAVKLWKSSFDRETLIPLLHERREFSDEQVEQIVSEVEKTWSHIYEQPHYLAEKAKEQYEAFTSVIADYLRHTGKEELNPEDIQRELTTLLHDPKTGAKAIKHRLAMMDRNTLVTLLSQREDLNEEQVNQIIDEVLENVRRFAKVPRRLARRTQEKAQEFQHTIADYLRSTDKEELNPEGIQRDIQLLLHDPRSGMGNLKERLSHFDRNTLVALLSQREDISEQDVQGIIEQILVVREQFLEKLQGIQHQIQTIIDNIFAKIRDYLNGLDRPELNYDGIKHDLRTVLADPEAGFEALRDRFSHIDRETLISILSSREDISQEQAENIIGQIEHSRDRILQRAERLQHQAQQQLEQVKHEAQQRMEETRKAATVASWWLFFIGLVSAFSSALGGAIGVLT